MSRRARFGQCCFLLLGLSAVREARAVECVTPKDWQPRAVLPFLDSNMNFINDAIDALAPGTRTEAIVYFNQCPSSSDLAALAVNGSTVDFVSKYLSVAVVTNVLASDARAFAQRSSVAFVDENRPIYASLDLSAQLIRTRAGIFSPATVKEAYPLLDGTGITIAFLDSGVDDGVHESLPGGKFVGGWGLFGVVNPDDAFTGHGTAVAGIALGTGGLAGTYRGIAPAADLADLNVLPGPSGNAVVFVFLQGAEKLLDNRSQWDVRIATLAFQDCTNSNGHDVMSEMANRMVSEGIFVVAAAGNRSKCNNPAGSFTPAPGAADDVVSVANFDDNDTPTVVDDAINPDSFQGPRPNDGDGDAEDEHKPDLAAPGTKIHAPCAEATQTSTCLPTDYRDQTGTSFAAAHVAGCAALALQVNPSLTPYDLKALFTDNTGASGWDPGLGYGLVNCYAAIHDLIDSPKTDVAMDDVIATGALFPTDPHIIEGWPNVINVLVKNLGPVTASRFRIDLGVFDFGNSEKDYHICRQTYNNVVSGTQVHMSCVWTPKKTGQSVHACLKARIIYPNDLEFGNNFEQHNVEIEPAHSPANFHMSIVNPTDQDLTMHITTTFPQGTNNWTLARSPAADFPLPSAACPVDLFLSLTPPASPGATTSRVDIAVEGITSGGVHLPLGGGTIIGERSTQSQPPATVAAVPNLTRGGAAILVLLLMGAGALLILVRRGAALP